MFDVFSFIDIEMPFTRREKVFCVLEYARSQLNKTVQHAFMIEFSKQPPSAMQILTWHKKYKEEVCTKRLFVQEERIWKTKDIRRDGRECAVSQAEHILNMYEIGYEIHISLNFSFKF